MKRKVIQIAESTQLISLPRKWALANKIKKGDEIDVRERGHDLIISVTPTEETRKIKIDISAKDQFLRRRIDSLYRAGYDEVEISFDNVNTLKNIQEVIPALLGFELVQQGENYAVIRNIASTAETEFDTILRRILNILKSLFAELSEAVSKRELGRCSEIVVSEDIVNKYCNLCERILNLKGHGDFASTNQYYYLVCQLEKIGDDLRAICYIFSKNYKIKPNLKLIEVVRRSSTFFSIFVEYFYKRDASTLSALKTVQQECMEDIRILTNQKKPIPHLEVAPHLYEIAHLIQHLSVHHYSEQV